MINQTFDVIRRRRAVRRFARAPVDERLLVELIDLANCAPSGFNLQPWHFILVRDAAVKQLLAHIAMDQIQVLEAPVIVVFASDPRAWKDTYSDVLKLGLSQGTISPDRAKRNHRNVRLMFRTGPFGIFGFLKKLVYPFHRLAKPTPNIITSRSDAVVYARAQTMLSVQNLLIAAESAGLATCPMEGFDEERLKKLLAIPKYMSVPVIVALGYPTSGTTIAPTPRLPLGQKLSFDLFERKL